MGTWRLGVLNGFVIPRLFPGDDVWVRHVKSTRFIGSVGSLCESGKGVEESSYL